jgi:hypothetical protein
VRPRGSVDAPWYARTAFGHWWAVHHGSVPEESEGARMTLRGESVARWRASRRQASRFRDDLPDLSVPLETSERRPPSGSASGNRAGSW